MPPFQPAPRSLLAPPSPPCTHAPQGGFARCFLFTSEKGRVLAGKVVDKVSLAKNKAKAKLLAEIKIHRSLSHRFVVGFESFFEDRHNVYIMLEPCANQVRCAPRPQPFACCCLQQRGCAACPIRCRPVARLSTRSRPPAHAPCPAPSRSR